MMRLLVLSTSLDPASRSRLLARRVFDRFEREGVEARWLDIAELDLPLCDGRTEIGHPGAQRLHDAIAEADGIVLGVGVYNYSASAAAKNAVELGAQAWRAKVVGFVCAAGGAASFMAAMGLANSLMLDFRTLIVPQFVFATSRSFDGDVVADREIEARLDRLAMETIRITQAVRGDLAIS